MGTWTRNEEDNIHITHCFDLVDKVNKRFHGIPAEIKSKEEWTEEEWHLESEARDVNQSLKYD